MAKYEQFGRFAVARLVDPINNSATALEVTTLDGFPTDGNFRIIVGAEIMLVTSISGSVFTVERGAESTTAVAHDSGSPVVQGLTAGALDAIGSENIPLWRDTNRPLMNTIVDGSGNILDSTDFTTLNGGTISDLDSGAISIVAPATSSHNVRGLYRSAPTAPYTVTTCFLPQLNRQNSTNYVGIGFRDSVSSNLLWCVSAIGPTTPGENLAVYLFTNPTTFNTSSKSRDYWHMGRNMQWMRMEDDSTNLKFYLSMDGINWLLVHQETRTANLANAPDEIFFGAHAGLGNAYATGITMVAWEED